MIKKLIFITSIAVSTINTMALAEPDWATQVRNSESERNILICRAPIFVSSSINNRSKTQKEWIGNVDLYSPVRPESDSRSCMLRKYSIKLGSNIMESMENVSCNPDLCQKQSLIGF